MHCAQDNEKWKKRDKKCLWGKAAENHRILEARWKRGGAELMKMPCLRHKVQFPAIAPACQNYTDGTISA
jgi:hypothetical protein